MAGLATNADLRPFGCETIRLGIVVFAQARRVTLRAHEIPVLVQLGPVQDVVVFDLFVRVEMKPALAAFVFRSRVPGNRQRLNTTVWKFDEILLEWIDAESVFDFEHDKL